MPSEHIRVAIPPELDPNVPLQGEKTVKMAVLGDVLALLLMVSMSVGIGVGVGAWQHNWGAGLAAACLPNWIIGVLLAFRA